MAQSVLALAYAFGAVAPTLAQDAAPPTTAKWRPKGGHFTQSPGKGFAEACGEFGDLIVGLREKDISSPASWELHRVRKLTDTGPGAIRIDMTCSDYNLAEDLKKPEETEFKEIVLLKKIDDKSMLVRKSAGWKIQGPGMEGCIIVSKEAQQMFREAEAKSKVDAEQMEAALKAAWQPRDGVYASAGADFDDALPEIGRRRHPGRRIRPAIALLSRSGAA